MTQPQRGEALMRVVSHVDRAFGVVEPGGVVGEADAVAGNDQVADAPRLLVWSEGLRCRSARRRGKGDESENCRACECCQ